MTEAQALSSGPSRKIPWRRLWSGLSRTAIAFAPLLLLWALLAHLEVWPRRYFPAPADVAWEGVNLLRNGLLSLHVSASLQRLAVGAALAIFAGIAVGVLLGVNKRAYRFFLPLVSFFQSIAEIGWLPLIVIWLGYGFAPIVLVISYTVFFTVALNTMTGIRLVPRNLVHSVQTLGGTRRDILLSVLLPGALPSMVTGLRLGLGYGWRALIAAEILIGQTGLGFMIFDARQFQATERIVLGMIVMGTLWLLTDRLILKPIETETIERWGMVTKSR